MSSGLSMPQFRLLAVLPDPPSEGMLCRGAKLNTAKALARAGLTKQVGVVNVPGDTCFHYFVRTPRGKALVDRDGVESE